MRRRLRPQPHERTLTVDGVTDTIVGWSLRVGVNAETIRTRLRKGWSEHEAVHGRPRRG